jgi:hypothetical protein
MKQSRYSEEVTQLLASLDGQQENTEPLPETPIPDTQEPIQDVYIQYIFIEREEDEQDIIDSTLTEPDTNVPYAPTIEPLTKTQARDEKTSKQVGLCMMSLCVILPTIRFFRRLADGGVRGAFRCEEQRGAFRREILKSSNKQLW